MYIKGFHSTGIAYQIHFPRCILHEARMFDALLGNETLRLQWGAPSSAGLCPPRTPALLRGAGTSLKSAKTGAIEGSESLSSAASGTTDDRLFGQCNACLLYTSPSPRDGLLSRMPSSA